MYAVGLSSLLLIAGGCAGDDGAAREDIYKESGNTINVQNREDMYNPNNADTNREKGEEFGYVRHQSSGIMGDTASYDDIGSIDREKVADTIGKIVLTVPNIQDVATLVTDEEVLMVYETDTQNRFETADQVKKSAMSVVPRYYHVYVTDDTSFLKEVENYAYIDSNTDNYEQLIDRTIQKIVKSAPQGRKMSDGENANGEQQGEMNERMNREGENKDNGLQQAENQTESNREGLSRTME